MLLSRDSLAAIVPALLLAGLLAPGHADARGSGSRSHSGGSQSSSHGGARSSSGNNRQASPHTRSNFAGRAHTTRKAANARRDAHGRIARSTRAKNEFKKSHPCPSTSKLSGACPGYVVDHITALKRGGADSPDNMQWQTKEEAKIKDKTE